MEITRIDKIHTTKKLAPKDGVHVANVTDTLSISSESQKKAEWIEMLKHMPDVRQEKMHGVFNEHAQDQEILSTVAKKILSEQLSEC